MFPNQVSYSSGQPPTVGEVADKAAVDGAISGAYEVREAILTAVPDLSSVDLDSLVLDPVDLSPSGYNVTISGLFGRLRFHPEEFNTKEKAILFAKAQKGKQAVFPVY